MTQQNPTVLNVAEKPSVARALAGVFNRMDGARDTGTQRSGAGANQVFTHENVRFPSVFAQGNGHIIQGPSKLLLLLLLDAILFSHHLFFGYLVFLLRYHIFLSPLRFLFFPPLYLKVVPHKMITSSVRGHLASQDFPANYGWNKCDPIALFDAPIETHYRDDLVPVERQLRQLSQQCNVLILWLDCDREGEAIGDEVQQVCLLANRRLQVYRAKFSTVMAPEIKRALQSLGRLNVHFVAAVQARSELDLRVGAAFTRFQTLRLQNKFDGFSDQGVVSYGPCQVRFVLRVYLSYIFRLMPTHTYTLFT